MAKSAFSGFEETWGCASANALPAMYGLENPSFEISPSVPHHKEDTEMKFSRDNISRTIRGKNAPNNSTDDEADVIFIQEWARKLSAKEGAKLTGMTPKGFQKVQSGENTISYKKLTKAMRGDPELAAAYAAHVGLILPGQAEWAAALTHAFNARARMGS